MVDGDKVYYTATSIGNELCEYVSHIKPQDPDNYVWVRYECQACRKGFCGETSLDSFLIANEVELIAKFGN